MIPEPSLRLPAPLYGRSLLPVSKDSCRYKKKIKKKWCDMKFFVAPVCKVTTAKRLKRG